MFGLSHRTAPLAVFERAALTEAAAERLLRDVHRVPGTREAMVVATRNRVEIYAVIAVPSQDAQAIIEVLSRYCGITPDGLVPHLYQHMDVNAFRHLLNVACGLDSIVAGEDQILGQLRSAFRLAQDHHTADQVLHGIVQRALRAGERARTQTRITRAEVGAVTRIIDEEVNDYQAGLHAEAVAPTVAALHDKAAAVVDSELARLTARLPELDEHTRSAIAATVRGVVDKFLHTPTVRVQELATAPGGGWYATVLRELFDLEERHVK